MTLPLTPVAAGSLTLTAGQALPFAAGLHADYIVQSDGVTAYAQSYVAGLKSFSNTANDAGAVTQSAITALGAAGGTVLLCGSLAWSTVPQLPPAITGVLKVRGTGRTVVTLSSAAPRFLDFGRTADYQTFQNIEVSDLVVDCNNVSGKHHVILGSFVNGSNLERINTSKITVRNVKALNVPTDPTTVSQRVGVACASFNTAGGGNACSHTDWLVDNVRIEGGDFGFHFTGDGSNTTNVTYNRITFRDCYHDTGVTQTASYGSANLQVGQHAQVGAVLIDGFYGANSGDVGIEVDQGQDVTIANAIIEEAAGWGYIFTNFHTPTNSATQTVKFLNCTARRQTCTIGSGFDLPDNGIALGRVYFENCTFYKNTADFIATNGQGWNVRRNLALLSMTNCQVIETGWTSPGSGSTHVMVYVSTGTAATTPIVIRNLNLVATGTRGASALVVNGIQLNGKILLDADGVRSNLAVTGSTAGGLITANVGPATSTISGVLRRVVPVASSDDTAPKGVVVGGTGTLTIPTKILIEVCDFSALPVGGTGISYTATSNAASVTESNNT